MGIYKIIDIVGTSDKSFSDPAQVEWFDENILLVLRHDIPVIL